MKVGLTYDLKDDYKGAGLDPETIAELDSIDTVEGIEAAIQAIARHSSHSTHTAGRGTSTARVLGY